MKPLDRGGEAVGGIFLGVDFTKPAGRPARYLPRRTKGRGAHGVLPV